MAHDPHNTSSIPVGTLVIALNGEILGNVREVHAHYILIDQPGEHLDLEFPLHAIERLTGDGLHISLNREALSAVDHEETARNVLENPESP